MTASVLFKWVEHFSQRCGEMGFTWLGRACDCPTHLYYLAVNIFRQIRTNLNLWNVSLLEKMLEVLTLSYRQIWRKLHKR